LKEPEGGSGANSTSPRLLDNVLREAVSDIPLPIRERARSNRRCINLRAVSESHDYTSSEIVSNPPAEELVTKTDPFQTKLEKNPPVPSLAAAPADRAKL